MSTYSGILLERAVNYVVKELHDNIDDALNVIDGLMADEDRVMATIMGPEYGPHRTPRPARFRTGHLPTLDTLEMDEYPYLAVWADLAYPTSDQAEWADTNIRMFIHAFLLSGDHSLVSRMSYRYLAAIQHITENNRMGGLVNPLETIGRASMGMALKRDYQEGDINTPWFVQPLIYELTLNVIME